jgi:uncharacterized protein
MTQTNTSLSFEAINEALAISSSPIQAAEAHGLICGIICVSPENITSSWQKLILGSETNTQSLQILQDLYIESLKQISEFSFEFALTLPNDNLDINIRTEALGLWCQGFLTGLRQAKTPIENGASEEVIDALNDLTEIAQVNSGNIEESPEDETAYMELVEYVRLVALMIFHELKTADLSEDNGLLH